MPSNIRFDNGPTYVPQNAKQRDPDFETKMAPVFFGESGPDFKDYLGEVLLRDWVTTDTVLSLTLFRAQCILGQYGMLLFEMGHLRSFPLHIRSKIQMRYIK